MSRQLLPEWEGVAAPIIGMLHLAALPGAPGFSGDLTAVRERLLHDVEALETGGVDGLLLENFGDAPFYPGAVPAATVAHMTALAVAVRVASSLPLGINVLRNDGRAALAVADASGAAFIRVNVLAGARLADQGVISGEAHLLARDRSLTARTGAGGAPPIRILADVDVKHSVPLGPWRLEDEVRDLLERAAADAVIVSGPATGGRVDLEELHRVRDAAAGAPVLVGSGVAVDTISGLVGCADGFIVGTGLKRDGRATEPVEVDRVRALVQQARSACSG